MKITPYQWMSVTVPMKEPFRWSLGIEIETDLYRSLLTNDINIIGVTEYLELRWSVGRW